MTVSPPSPVTVEVDPAEVGLDAGRLDRIERHLAPYVDDGRLPGWLVVVSRGGRVAYATAYGRRDLEAGLPVEPDTLWRIYSMTKPVTSVAAMMLLEEGAFELKDEVARFIPAYAGARVWTGGSDLKPVTQPLTRADPHLAPADPHRRAHLRLPPRAPRRRHLPRRGLRVGPPPGMDLAACCDAWAGLPLLFQPGREWNYSVATDVLGRVVEIVSGQPLDAFMAERIFGPLGMTDTGFWVAEARAERLAALYSPDPGDGPGHCATTPWAARCLAPPDCLAGGGGLVSTAADFHRFCELLRGRGALDGVRLLGPRTVRLHGRQPPPRAAPTSRPSGARCSPRPPSRASASGSASPS